MNTAIVPFVETMAMVSFFELDCICIFFKKVKVITMQNCNDLNTVGRYVYPLAMIMHNGDIYFTDYDGLAFFKLDAKTFEPSMVEIFVGENKNYPLFSNVLSYKEFIYLISCSKCHILEFNTKSEKNKHILLNVSDKLKNGIYYNANIANNRIFIFGFEIDAILMYDINTGKSLVLSQCSNDVFEKLSSPPKKGLYIYSSTVVGNDIYAVSFYGNFILKINSIDLSYEIIPLKNVSDGFNSIVYDMRGSLWLIPINGDNFVKYNIKSNQIKIINKNFKIIKEAFGYGILTGKNIFINSGYLNKCLNINILNDTIEEVKIINDLLNNDYKDKEVFGYPLMINSNEIIITMLNTSDIILYNISNNSVQKREIGEFENICFIDSSRCIGEKKYESLNDFIEIVGTRSYEIKYNDYVGRAILNMALDKSGGVYANI